MTYRSYSFLFSVVMLALISILLGISGTQRIEDFNHGQKQIMQTLANSTRGEVATIISDLHRHVQLFAADNEDLIRKIARVPNDETLLKALRQKVDVHFPDRLAFTIANPRGRPLLEDISGLVGEVCKADIAHFASNTKHQNLVFIHPQPFHYHFDIMATWGTDYLRGIFFISMKPTLLVELLTHRALPDFSLLLLKDQDPGLIEISSQGTRDQLNRQPRLSPEERQRIEFSPSVPGTKWRLAVVPRAGLFTEFREQVLMQSFFVLFIVLLVIAVMMTLVAKGEERREQAEEELKIAYQRLEQRVAEQEPIGH